MIKEAGERIGDYEILGALGSGGMGQVFKARNIISDRVEALKVLRPDLSGRQDLSDRFLREIKIVAALNHPNIAVLRTALTVANQLVMVMEYVEGATLAARLEHGRVPIEEALNYIDQVLNALSYAHGQNVVHRDIKPANMMLTPAGVIKLMDFGIARSSLDDGLTVTGTTMGTLSYMSPEQVRRTCCDARSDLYSVGVSLYEMVTGERPFLADCGSFLMPAQVQTPPKPPMKLRTDIPSALNEIILVAMAREPEARFQSADAFRDAVNAVRQGLRPAHPARVPGTRPNSSFAATALLRDAARATSVTEASSTSLEPPPAVPPQLQTQEGPPPATGKVSTEPSERRGLYITLGALIVLAILLLASLYVPLRNKTSASTQVHTNQLENSAPAESSQNQEVHAADTEQGSSIPSGLPPGLTSSADTSESTGISNFRQHADSPVSPPNVAAGSNAATNSTLHASGSSYRLTGNRTAVAPVEKKPGTTDSTGIINTMGGYGSSRPQQSKPEEAQAADGQQIEAPSADQWEQMEHEADQLSSRASSINESLDNLQRQQSAQGLALRGDISAAQAMMNASLAAAHSAFQDQDASKARRHLGLAQAEIEKLEQFLGY